VSGVRVPAGAPMKKALISTEIGAFALLLHAKSYSFENVADLCNVQKCAKMYIFLQNNFVKIL
jgi:hypothetical protein